MAGAVGKLDGIMSAMLPANCETVQKPTEELAA
jgi:hypothetical protein